MNARSAVFWGLALVTAPLAPARAAKPPRDSNSMASSDGAAPDAASADRHDYGGGYSSSGSSSGGSSSSWSPGGESGSAPAPP